MKAKLKIAAWVTLVVGVIVLLYLMRSYQERQVAKEPEVAISVDDENAFITAEELKIRLKRYNLMYPGMLVSAINAKVIEDTIRKMPEVETVDVFKQMGGNWKISVKVRKPLARIFNSKGESYYVDRYGNKMSTSANFCARVMVFSGNIPDKKDSLNVDDIINNKFLKSSNSLDQIYRISKYVCDDPFLRSLIAQVHRNQWGDFILIPQVGGHEIVFGTANSDQDVKEKFEKLKTFYKEGIPYEGWNKYSSINLKYKNQIVGKKRNDDERTE